jgi:hypothetical protein
MTTIAARIVVISRKGEIYGHVELLKTETQPANVFDKIEYDIDGSIFTFVNGKMVVRGDKYVMDNLTVLECTSILIHNQDVAKDLWSELEIVAGATVVLSLCTGIHMSNTNRNIPELTYVGITPLDVSARPAVAKQQLFDLFKKFDDIITTYRTELIRVKLNKS